MPIYEYRCEACGCDLEKLQRINDDALVVCPECGEPELRRLVSAAGFRLKGGGWYETDFKKGGKKNLHDSGGSSGVKTSDTPAETKKADPKPAPAKTSAD